MYTEEQEEFLLQLYNITIILTSIRDLATEVSINQSLFSKSKAKQAFCSIFLIFPEIIQKGIDLKM